MYEVYLGTSGVSRTPKWTDISILLLRFGLDDPVYYTDGKRGQYVSDPLSTSTVIQFSEIISGDLWGLALRSTDRLEPGRLGLVLPTR